MGWATRMRLMALGLSLHPELLPLQLPGGFTSGVRGGGSSGAPTSPPQSSPEMTSEANTTAVPVEFVTPNHAGGEPARLWAAPARAQASLGCEQSPGVFFPHVLTCLEDLEGTALLWLLYVPTAQTWKLSVGPISLKSPLPRSPLGHRPGLRGPKHHL